MAYIYKIVNRVNQKVYIGKTQGTIEERFKQHLSEYKKPRCEKRPLYDAMNKYGIENFSVELVEETNNPEEQEQYWINYYRSYIGFSDCNGYNATLGGDGKSYADKKAILSLFKSGLNETEISKELGYDQSTIQNALYEAGITHKEIQEQGQNKYKKSVIMLNKDTEEQENSFNSLAEAERFLGKSNGRVHIAEVCNGKRNSAYGYRWKWANI